MWDRLKSVINSELESSLNLFNNLKINLDKKDKIELEVKCDEMKSMLKFMKVLEDIQDAQRQE
jgi:hypothetical protein